MHNTSLSVTDMSARNKNLMDVNVVPLLYFLVVSASLRLRSHTQLSCKRIKNNRGSTEIPLVQKGTNSQDYQFT